MSYGDGFLPPLPNRRETNLEIAETYNAPDAITNANAATNSVFVEIPVNSCMLSLKKIVAHANTNTRSLVRKEARSIWFYQVVCACQSLENFGMLRTSPVRPNV